MRTRTVILGIVVSAFALEGCPQNTSPGTTLSAPQAPPQTSALEARITALEKKLEAVSNEAAGAKIRVLNLQNRYVSAEFDPTDPKFQRIDTSVASFAVLVADVSQFGDGTRVKLNLGNLSSGGVADVTLHMTYGPRAPDDYNTYATWENSLKKKDADITTTLAAGGWNPISVVLPGIEPRNF
jgi:hypothetical protein